MKNKSNLAMEIMVAIGFAIGVAIICFLFLMLTDTKLANQVHRCTTNEEAIIPNKGAINYGDPHDSWRYAYGDILIEETEDYYIYEGQYGTYKILK